MVYKRIEPKKLTGTEIFLHSHNTNPVTIMDYWRYAFSNLNSNVTRGTLAEFLVETALDNDIGVRNPWGDYDIPTKEGIKIEVKCGSYLQDWDQNDLSKVVFGRLKAKELYWSEAVKPFAQINKENTGYKADIYIFALLSHQDPTILNPLDLEQWSFYILTRSKVSEITHNGKSLSLAKLDKFGVVPVRYNQIKSCVQELSK